MCPNFIEIQSEMTILEPLSHYLFDIPCTNMLRMLVDAIALDENIIEAMAY